MENNKFSWSGLIKSYHTVTAESYKLQVYLWSSRAPEILTCGNGTS